MYRIDRAEALRYLGYRGQAIEPQLDALIDDCMEECLQIARPRSVWRRFEVSFPEGEADVTLPAAGFALPGRDIRAHLSGCGACYLLAATLGVEIDAAIRRYEAGDLTRSLILDACATCLIESVCDEAETAIRSQAAKAGKGLTSRYSPGYGDLTIEIQPRFTALLDTPRRIGLYCSGSYILMPRKSVTAVLGLRDEPAGRTEERRGCGRRCVDCRLKDCLYRKEDAPCA